MQTTRMVGYHSEQLSTTYHSTTALSYLPLFMQYHEHEVSSQDAYLALYQRSFGDQGILYQLGVLGSYI